MRLMKRWLIPSWSPLFVVTATGYGLSSVAVSIVTAPDPLTVALEVEPIVGGFITFFAWMMLSGFGCGLFAGAASFSTVRGTLPLTGLGAVGVVLLVSPVHSVPWLHMLTSEGVADRPSEIAVFWLPVFGVCVLAGTIASAGVSRALGGGHFSDRTLILAVAPDGSVLDEEVVKLRQRAEELLCEHCPNFRLLPIDHSRHRADPEYDLAIDVEELVEDVEQVCLAAVTLPDGQTQAELIRAADNVIAQTGFHTEAERAFAVGVRQLMDECARLSAADHSPLDVDDQTGA
ncbi:hypothetical protein [Brevibacterium gallinarum]|uniref:Uncharacterized protein n=1 Tax=Brevibacterium gallinarum TaxID=2762220 RepID=A0ABR8WS85_9MICO|nr:hypothetical protein [Brevibacterium gallinarum]MBD8019860.1 hypothetical protein [Brevibacterium gallinarum]